MSRKFQIIFLCMSLVFVCSLYFHPYKFSYVVKVLPIALLLLSVILARPFPEKSLLMGAVFFSGCGDVILDLTFPKAFIMGLLSFLSAHVLYIIIFSQNFKVNKRFLPLTVMGILFPAGMYFFLFSHLGSMKIPVAVYVTVIAIMFLTSVNRRSVNLLVMAGAATFLISDSLLATNKFYKALPLGRVMVMTTYYLAQGLIIHGYLRERVK